MNQHNGEGRFIEEGWFKKFAEGMVLVGSRCEACKKVFFPKKEVCPDCFEGELKEIPLSKRGKLHSYTISFMSLPGMKIPYAVGFIELPEGIKLFSILTDCKPYERVLKVDMEMEMVIEKIKQDESGNEILGYKFRPVNKGEKL
jgi:uncharacterized OB-fold protein